MILEGLGVLDMRISRGQEGESKRGHLRFAVSVHRLNRRAVASSADVGERHVVQEVLP